MQKNYIGIDNGVTGTISIITHNGRIFHESIPTKKELSYTKAKQYISRIDINKFKDLVLNFCESLNDRGVFCLIERPMVNPMRFKSSLSAVRALEATLIVLEEIKLPFQYIDSKEWQKYFFPKDIEISDHKSKKKVDTKKTAITVAKRLFPQIPTKDADSLLIAEYARRMNL